MDGRTHSESIEVSTHSRAEAAAHKTRFYFVLKNVSTHSRAEAAAIKAKLKRAFLLVSTHSRAEAAAIIFNAFSVPFMFQHTAARRRLPSSNSLIPCS